MPEPENQEDDSQATSPPEGIKPIFLSGPSQQIFGCVTDTDVTDENPFKFISKAAIAEDFKTRAAISDFHPVKKQVQEYEEEELLLVYDREYTYGENFYICLTVAAKERILNPPKPEGEEGEIADEEGEEEIEMPKTPEPKEWVCLGSDQEILDATVKNSRELLQYTFARQRKFFNGPCNFGDRNAGDHSEHFVSIASVEDENFELQKMELDHSIQAVPMVVDRWTQTDKVKPFSKAIQYEPRLMDEKTAEDTLKSSGMKEFVAKAHQRFDLALQQTEIGNIFVDDYQELSETDGIVVDKTDNAIKEYQSYTDLSFSKDKIITWIEWHPTMKGIVAVSCGENFCFGDRVDLMSRLILNHHLILIWSFADPIHPVLFLEAPDDILCFHFNPYQPNFVVGGCYNGQIVMWDIAEYEDRFQFNKPLKASDTKGNMAAQAVFDTDPKLDHAPFVHYCVLSNIESGHRKPIYDIQWLPPQIEIDTKTGDLITKNITEEQPQCLQLVTASIDGTASSLGMSSFRLPRLLGTRKDKKVGDGRKNKKTSSVYLPQIVIEEKKCVSKRTKAKPPELGFVDTIGIAQRKVDNPSKVLYRKSHYPVRSNRRQRLPSIANRRVSFSTDIDTDHCRVSHVNSDVPEQSAHQSRDLHWMYAHSLHLFDVGGKHGAFRRQDFLARQLLELNRRSSMDAQRKSSLKSSMPTQGCSDHLCPERVESPVQIAPPATPIPPARSRRLYPDTPMLKKFHLSPYLPQRKTSLPARPKCSQFKWNKPLRHSLPPLNSMPTKLGQPRTNLGRYIRSQLIQLVLPPGQDLRVSRSFVQIDPKPLHSTRARRCYSECNLELSFKPVHLWKRSENNPYQTRGPRLSIGMNSKLMSGAGICSAVSPRYLLSELPDINEPLILPIEKEYPRLLAKAKELGFHTGISLTDVTPPKMKGKTLIKQPKKTKTVIPNDTLGINNQPGTKLNSSSTHNVSQPCDSQMPLPKMSELLVDQSTCSKRTPTPATEAVLQRGDAHHDNNASEQPTPPVEGSDLHSGTRDESASGLSSHSNHLSADTATVVQGSVSPVSQPPKDEITRSTAPTQLSGRRGESTAKSEDDNRISKVQSKKTQNEGRTAPLDKQKSTRERQSDVSNKTTVGGTGGTSRKSNDGNSQSSKKETSKTVGKGTSRNVSVSAAAKVNTNARGSKPQLPLKQPRKGAPPLSATISTTPKVQSNITKAMSLVQEPIAERPPTKSNQRSSVSRNSERASTRGATRSNTSHKSANSSVSTSTGTVTSAANSTEGSRMNSSLKEEPTNNDEKTVEVPNGQAQRLVRKPIVKKTRVEEKVDMVHWEKDSFKEEAKQEGDEERRKRLLRQLEDERREKLRQKEKEEQERLKQMKEDRNQMEKEIQLMKAIKLQEENRRVRENEHIMKLRMEELERKTQQAVNCAIEEEYNEIVLYWNTLENTELAYYTSDAYLAELKRLQAEREQLMYLKKMEEERLYQQQLMENQRKMLAALCADLQKEWEDQKEVQLTRAFVFSYFTDNPISSNSE